MDSQDIQIWTASIDDIDVAQASDVLSATDLQRAEGMGSPLLRRRFLARRLMVQELLTRASGKETVWWSASNSSGLAAVAISASRVGLDIERDDDRPLWSRIARRFFTAAEQRAAAGSPTRFLEHWTMKEAYLKAVGLGLAGGLDSLDCTGLSQPVDSWSTSTAHPGWRFRHVHPEPGFIGALAVEGSPGRLEVRRWTLNAAPEPRARA